MTIHLLLNHTALIEDDRKTTVTVYPPCAGTLAVEDNRFTMAPTGSPIPRLPGVIGYVKAVFIDERGIRYPVINPHVKAEVPYSAVDFTKEYFRVVRYVDTLAREVERLTQELLDMRAQLEPDALGHLNIGGEENEKEKDG